MEVKFGDLNGKFECDRRRKRNINLNTDHTGLGKTRSSKIRDLFVRLIKGAVLPSDVESEIFQSLVDDPTLKSKRTAELYAADDAKRLLRLVNDLERHIADPNMRWSVIVDLGPKDIKISAGGEDIVVHNVRPDFAIMWGNHIEVYQIRIGKKQAGDRAETDKKVYALMEYAKTMLRSPGVHTLTAGMAYLRKGTDEVRSAAKPNAQFDQFFFTNDRDVISDNIDVISMQYDPAVSTAGTLFEKQEEKLFEKFAEGYSPEECTEEQCKSCDLYDACHYTRSPASLEETEKAVDISLISLSGIQEQIELFKSGYALVNAVPGAGKTLVLVLRIINLLMNGVKPEEIVIITFTNSGAEVFKNRIAQYNEDFAAVESVDDMIATTFNGLGQMILEREYKSLGFAKPPRVIDQIERYSIISEMLNSHPDIPDLDYRNFTTDMKFCKGPLAVASHVFALMKQKGYTRFDAQQISHEVGSGFCTPQAAAILADMYDDYNAELQNRGLVEFADQEVMILEMLEKDPYYFDQYGWKHILVDECQDTSENQFKLLKYMSQTASFESLMVVGDDAQSIYGFRDTSPEYFMNFESVMGLPEGTVHSFYMTDNFRSTPEIIDFANKIIEKNTWKVQKDILPQNPSGSAVTVKGFIDQSLEYEYIVREISKKIEDGIAPEKIAFIASTRTELLKMTDLLTNEGIPSVLLNPELMLENSRIRAGLALARYFQDKNDTKDIVTCLNAAFMGDLYSLTDEQINQAIEIKQQEAEAIRALPEDQFREEYFKILETFDDDDEIYQSFINTLSAQPTMGQVFAYCNNFELFGEREAKRREHDYPGVVVTTAHSSKGMEWDIVFNSLTKYDTADIHQSRKTEEEKRRLLFVSATRARKELYITGTYVAYGGMKNRHYNMYLKEACEVAGEEFDADKISAMYAARARERRQKREEEKKRKQAELMNEIYDKIEKGKAEKAG